MVDIRIKKDDKDAYFPSLAIFYGNMYSLGGRQTYNRFTLDVDLI